MSSAVISSGGTDNGTTRLRQEAGLAVAYGLPWRKALAAITLAPARVFGVDGELGSIAKGKRGDLLIKLHIKLPNKLSRRERELVEQLKKEGI